MSLTWRLYIMIDWDKGSAGMIRQHISGNEWEPGSWTRDTRWKHSTLEWGKLRWKELWEWILLYGEQPHMHVERPMHTWLDQDTSFLSRGNQKKDNKKKAMTLLGNGCSGDWSCMLGREKKRREKWKCVNLFTVCSSHPALVSLDRICPWLSPSYFRIRWWDKGWRKGREGEKGGRKREEEEEGDRRLPSMIFLRSEVGILCLTSGGREPASSPQPSSSVSSLPQVVAEPAKEENGIEGNLVKIKNKSSLEATSWDGRDGSEGVWRMDLIWLSFAERNNFSLILFPSLKML